MNAGGYRGIYNSAYAGMATALAGGLWLMFAGFYVVRGTIDRDQRTGVGQILAATPLRNAGYLAGKFCSNLLVLASMAGVLAVTALALQLARGESRAVGPGALLLPFALFTLPVLAVTAAAAVLFDALPVLRGGLGNIAWFFVWMDCVIAGGGAPLGGMGAVTASMHAAMTAQHLPPAGEFSVGFTKVSYPLRTFTWHGLEPSGGLITSRMVLIIVAAVLAALPAIWFGRFDPARTRPRRSGAPAPDGETPGTPAPATGQAARLTPSPAYKPLPPVGTRPVLAAGRLLAGEARILVQGIPRWWWLAAAAFSAASLAVPASIVKPAGASTALLLSAAWIWPALIWSRLGTQRHENGLDTLLGAYPGAYRQVAAEWAAGLLLTALTGLGPLLRMAASGDGPGTAAWIAGALFIPALALMLGTASRTHRMFQGHLRHLVVRGGQPGQGRRLHGNRPGQRPPSRTLTPADRRGRDRDAHGYIHHPSSTTRHAVTITCEYRGARPEAA